MTRVPPSLERSWRLNVRPASSRRPLDASSATSSAASMASRSAAAEARVDGRRRGRRAVLL
eukprot:988280-Prymnesium_polylepis.1